MRTSFIFLVTVALLTNCASQPTTNNIAQLDMSASVLISKANDGTSTHMTAEVVFIKDAVSQQAIYRYDIAERRQLKIDSQVLSLEPGRYEITTVCADSGFTHRLSGLLSVELKQERFWWAKFATSSGSEAYLPATQLNLSLNGGERITPVSLAATGEKSCEVLYGDIKPNTRPESNRSVQDYREKYGKKITFYN